MSQGNHTPGPWEVVRRDQLQGVRHVDHEGRAFDVCRVDWHSFYKPDTKAEANARLIAAAPRLLAALEAMAETYARDADVYDPRTEPALIEARAAIQQATGEA